MVRLRSIGPPEYEEPIDEAFLRRGWTVVSSAGMTMQGRVMLSAERVSAMTTSERDAAMVRLAGQAAHDLQVDWAYSVEAALGHVKRARPALAGLPVVLVGCSFGAIVSPTAAARVDPDAMVLVGGGSDGLRTLVWAAEEVFDGPGLFVDGEGRGVTRAMAEAAVGAYLEGFPFDSYNVAPALAGTPTLLLHGASDGIVDSRFGDLLWERLGRPERWVGNYGHSLLFYLLPDSAAEIAAWAEGALEARRRSGGGG
jgi:alpha-beta hydrolase superfamily lysophospholipase